MAKKQHKTIGCSFKTQITVLQPKPDTSDEDLALLFKVVDGLKKHIPCLIAVSTGENQSTHHRGYTHGIVLHFEDEERMRDAIRKHH